jgi:tol-pal system protein YbgF
MTERVRRVLLITLAALAGSGCATRQDLQVVQNDLRLIRDEAARDDSLRSAQIQQLSASLRSINDSLASVSRGLTRLRADLQGRLATVEEQLNTAQELATQSQRRVQELRASMEQASGRRSGDTAGTAGTGGTASPGPNQLYQMGRDQFLRGSNAAARMAFEELLANHPQSDVADEAQFFVAETYAAEGNTAAADSVYGLVVTRYSRSSRAPTALYKRAVIAEGGGRTAEARTLYNQVIARFPRSDEAQLARDRLTARR